MVFPTVRRSRSAAASVSTWVACTPRLGHSGDPTKRTDGAAWPQDCHVDISLLECMTQSMQGHEWLHASLMDLPGFARSVEIPSIEPAKDGWVGMSMVTGQQWRDFATMVEQPQLVDDPELCLQLGRWPRREEVYGLDPSMACGPDRGRSGGACQSVPGAHGSPRQRRHHPGDGSLRGTTRVRRPPGGLPPAATSVADVASATRRRSVRPRPWAHTTSPSPATGPLRARPTRHQPELRLRRPLPRPRPPPRRSLSQARASSTSPRSGPGRQRRSFSARWVLMW